MSESDSEETSREDIDTSDEESSSESKPSDKKKAKNADDEDSEGNDETVTIFEFMQHMGGLLKLKWIAIKLRTRLEEDKDTIDGIIAEYVNVIKNFDRIDYLNPELLALASCYDIYYTKKSKPDGKNKVIVEKVKVNEENVTEFIKMVDKETSKNSIDIIRYIRMYQANKNSL